MNKLYSNDKTKQIDQLAAEYLGVDSYELMQLAAAAVHQHVKNYKHLLVVTGPGNNGGDGFVVAELARREGQRVQVVAMRPVVELQGDARVAADAFQGTVLSWDEFNDLPQHEFDVVVDAVLGTGLNKTVNQPYTDVINWLNQLQVPVISIDIPSGLNGTTGQIEGVAVRAVQTIAILVCNTGLFTLNGKDCCGEVVVETLGVPETAYQNIDANGQLLVVEQLKQIPRNRQQNSHKGQFGHVIVAGGQLGMLGAVLLASSAVLKAGAGTSTVLTDSNHANSVPIHSPEVMSLGFDGQSHTEDLINYLDGKSIDVLLLGVGLGQSQWSKKLFKSCVNADVPLVIDADGLNLLSKAATVPKTLQVITPHPKEAAMLLNLTVTEVQNNRWFAVNQLATKYNCVAVLKGSGTLIADGQQTWCCPFGNANLATAGSGDVLAGMITGLMAQGFSPSIAAQSAVIWHALVGEYSRYGLSMTATDLLNTLHEIWGSDRQHFSPTQQRV